MKHLMNMLTILCDWQECPFSPNQNSLQFLGEGNNYMAQKVKARKVDPKPLKAQVWSNPEKSGKRAFIWGPSSSIAATLQDSHRSPTYQHQFGRVFFSCMLLNVTLLDFDLASIQDFWQRQSSQYYRCLFIFPKPAGSSHVALSLRCGSTRPIDSHFFRDPPCNIKCTSCGSRLAKHVVHGPKPSLFQEDFQNSPNVSKAKLTSRNFQLVHSL